MAKKKNIFYKMWKLAKTNNIFMSALVLAGFISLLIFINFFYPLKILQLLIIIGFVFWSLYLIIFGWLI